MSEETYVLSRATAQALDALLRDRRGRPTEQRPARGGSWGRMPVVVQCTSTTAASGSGIGAQCYPAVMIGCHATETTQPEQTAVWLTLLGDGAAAEAPTADSLYHGLFAGDFDPGSDNRPRVFAVAPSGGGGAVSSDLNEMTGSTNFFIVGDSFWYDVATASATASVADLSLPSAGTYLLTMQVSGGGALSAGGPELIYARLYNETDAVAVPGTTIVVTDVNGITAFRGTSSSGSVAVPLVTTGAKTIRLEARRSNFNTSTWVAHPSFYNNSLSSSSPGGTSIGYIKLS